MASEDAGGLDLLFRLLVAYRLAFYLGGLIGISLPIGLVWVFGIEPPPAARTAIVAVSFGVIVLTYVAERRVGLDHVDARTGEAAESYSLRLRVAVLAAIAGVAVGVYLLSSDRPFAGILFVFGALVFLQWGYRREAGSGDAG